jgi:arginyl-tRNA synthetase
VRRAIQAILLPPVADRLPGISLTVERSPRAALGDVRVRVGGRGAKVDASMVAAVAADLSRSDAVAGTTVIPPSVYLRLDIGFLHDTVVDQLTRPAPTRAPAGRGLAILSFSDPNVNKPLHLGHLRNNFLGMALCRMLQWAGWTVECQADHNDWGLPLCQAAAAYRRFGGDTTPASTATKADHFVGRHYVRFHDPGLGAGRREALDREAAALLRGIEFGDAGALELCERLARWAEEGIQATYRRIGTELDRVLFGSHYVVPGNALIRAAVDNGTMTSRPDGSVYLDLHEAGLDDVTVVRSDGTPLFYRQWFAMDVDRFGSGGYDRAILLSGREWRAGFRTYTAALRRLGHRWVERIESIHYGMVNLPEGRMSSRRGAVVAADELVSAVADGLSDRGDGGAAVALLGWHFLRRDRERDLTFDETELWHNSRPELRRLAGLLDPDRHRPGPATAAAPGTGSSRDSYRELLLRLDEFPAAAAAAVDALEPARIARYLQRLTEVALRAPLPDGRSGTVATAVAGTVRQGLSLLNIHLEGATAAALDARPDPLAHTRPG